MRKNFSNFAMLTHNGLTEVLQTYQPILAARLNEQNSEVNAWRSKKHTQSTGDESVKPELNKKTNKHNNSFSN